MTNLTTASAQWTSRPDDQRFADLESLQAAVDARRQLSVQRTLRLDTLRIDHDESNLYIVDGVDQPVQFTNWSFGQLCTIAKAPASYLRSLPTPMADGCLEYGLRTSDDARSESKLLYTRGEDGGLVGELRAATGPKYGRIWDSQIVTAVRRMNDRAGNIWTVPTPFKKAGGGQAYDASFVADKRSTTLYASDRDIFLFLVDESRPIQVDDQTYFRGFYTWNSEVGNATFGLATFLYSYVCANRIIWGARDIEELKIRHTHLAPDRFIEQATPALAALSESSAEPILETIKRAKATQLGKNVAEVKDFLAKKGFGKFETKVALQLAARGGDTGSSGDPTILWDVIQGGTAAARELGHQDSRLDQEKRWSSLLREVSSN